MSKNELRVIARIMLIGVGFDVLLQLFLNTLNGLAAMPFTTPAETKIVPMIFIVLGIYALTALVTVYFLARCVNRFSSKIAESEPADDTQISWLAVAFRLICVTAGVLFLYWSVPNLIVTVINYVVNMNINNKSGLRHIYTGMSSIADIAKCVLLLGLSIYLACGAPGFVRWQVRKTLKQCSEIEQEKPTLG